MLEIAPPAPAYPVQKPRAIKPGKDFDQPPQPKKKPALEEQPPPAPHIDEFA
jgi:hypothetical protein